MPDPRRPDPTPPAALPYQYEGTDASRGTVACPQCGRDCPASRRKGRCAACRLEWWLPVVISEERTREARARMERRLVEG
jgi:hypothetical protein